MPPKRDKRKAGPSANGGSSSGNTATGRRMTRHNASSAAANSAASAAPPKRVAASKPESSGRSTNNSRGKRRVAAASRTPTPTVKRVKRVPKGGKKEKELNSFKDENGEVYKVGGKRVRERGGERERETSEPFLIKVITLCGRDNYHVITIL